MLYDHRQKINTPAGQLRECLTQLEVQLGKLGYSTKEELLSIPSLFEQAFEILTDLQQRDIPVSGEQARFDTLSRTFKQKAALFLKRIGGAAELDKARPSHIPDRAHWWWFIDAWWAEQKRRRARRTYRTTGIVAAVLVLFGLLYMIFFAPDEATKARFRHEQAAERLTQQGDYAAALDEVNAALTYAPDAAELYVFRGVLEEQLDRDAALSFEKAQVLFADQQAFLLARSQDYLTLFLMEQALADVDAVIAETPDSAQAYFIRGRIYHILREYTKADENYTLAAEFAAAAGETELEAMVRIQQAYLMQEMLGGAQ